MYFTCFSKMKNLSSVLIALLIISNVATQAQKTTQTDPKSVSVTFLNKSLTSIPLRIEGVMNPNLSPMSSSGVTAAEGTRVYYRKKGKDVLVFTFTEEYNDTEVIVDELLKEQGLR